MISTQPYVVMSSDPLVQTFVGNPARVYPHGRAPDRPTYPYVTFRTGSGTPENTLSERPLVDQNRVQVDCWSKNDGTGGAQIGPLAKAVRDAMEQHYSMLSYMESDGPDSKTGSYRVTMDFLVWNHRDQST